MKRALDAGPTGPPATHRPQGPGRRLCFEEDLASFVYGFAGDAAPVRETVELLDDLLADFVVRIVVEGVRVGTVSGAGLCPESLMYTVRRDARMRDRVKELLAIYEEIKSVRDAVGSGKVDSRTQVRDQSEGDTAAARRRAKRTARKPRAIAAPLPSTSSPVPPPSSKVAGVATAQPRSKTPSRPVPLEPSPAHASAPTASPAPPPAPALPDVAMV